MVEGAAMGCWAEVIQEEVSLCRNGLLVRSAFNPSVMSHPSVCQRRYE